MPRQALRAAAVLLHCCAAATTATGACPRPSCARACVPSIAATHACSATRALLLVPVESGRADESTAPGQLEILLPSVSAAHAARSMAHMAETGEYAATADALQPHPRQQRARGASPGQYCSLRGGDYQVRAPWLFAPSPPRFLQHSIHQMGIGCHCSLKRGARGPLARARTGDAGSPQAASGATISPTAAPTGKPPHPAAC